MTQELLYTSAPRGLKPGSRGFCTVVSTRGLSAPLAATLESLSGYRPIFPPGHPESHRNPLVYSHVTTSAGGQRHHVLSRISDFGLDYSGRGNKLAHHVVVAGKELTKTGPAWLLTRPEFMQSTWDGTPGLLDAGRRLPAGESRPGICRAWADLTGDAGWAGVLAESFLSAPDRPVHLIFSPGMNLLPLFVEAIALLPPQRRWEATFTTYYTNLAPGVTCVWRGLLKNSAEAKQARRQVHALRLDLTQPLDEATGGELVQFARTGSAASRTSDAIDEAADEQAPDWFGGSSRPAAGANAPPPLPVGVEEEDAPAYRLASSGPPRPPVSRTARPPRDRRRLHALYADDAHRRSRRWRIFLFTLAGLLLLVPLAGGGYWLFRDGSAAVREMAEVPGNLRKRTAVAEELTQPPRHAANPKTPDANAQEEPPHPHQSPLASNSSPRTEAPKRQKPPSDPPAHAEERDGSDVPSDPLAESNPDDGDHQSASIENSSTSYPEFFYCPLEFEQQNDKTFAVIISETPTKTGQVDATIHLDLLMPTPLPYQVKRMEEDLVLSRGNLLLGRFSVHTGLDIRVQFVQSQPKRATMTDALRSLQWCVLRTTNGNSSRHSNYLLHQQTAAAEPLDQGATRIIRNAREQTIWRLPNISAPSDVPSLLCGPIVASFGGVRCTFLADRSVFTSNEAILLESKELWDHLTTKLQVSEDIFSPRPALELKVVQIQQNAEHKEDVLGIEVSLVRIYERWDRQIAQAKEQIRIAEKNRKNISHELELVRGQLKTAKGTIVKKLREKESQLGESLMMAQAEETAQNSRKSKLEAFMETLSSVTVDSARIYYEVRPPGGDESDVVPIDVINFGPEKGR